MINTQLGHKPKDTCPCRTDTRMGTKQIIFFLKLPFCSSQTLLNLVLQLRTEEARPRSARPHGCSTAGLSRCEPEPCVRHPDSGDTGAVPGRVPLRPLESARLLHIDSSLLILPINVFFKDSTEVRSTMLSW